MSKIITLDFSTADDDDKDIDDDGVSRVKGGKESVYWEIGKIRLKTETGTATRKQKVISLLLSLTV